MLENLQSLKNEAIAQITDTKSDDELNDLRVAYLGRNGKLTSAFKEIKNLSAEEKKQAGILINDIKGTILTTLAAQSKSFEQTEHEWFDPTVPGIQPRTGSHHIVTQAIEQISQVFSQIGFIRMRYPEVERDWYAFESLNFDALHPARDDWETFFVDAKPDSKLGPMVLTPHTSSGQVREMQRTKPPIRMINIAKCYRRESDTRHVPMFHQFEGLVIDKGIAITHLKGTLDYFAKNFFGPNRKTRIRPYNFPFTEPSFEVDINCGVCEGTLKLPNRDACKACKQGWHELGGAGMVHPNVLKAGGINPKEYSGFAFGWGVERTYMMRSGLNIPDLRMLYSSDLRYLRQF